MTSDRQTGPVFHVILLAVFIRNETATCNCLMSIQSMNHTLRSDVCGNILLSLTCYMENVATSPCYHVVVTHVCLDASTLILYLINSDLLFNRLFSLYELILSFSFRLKQHFLLLKFYGGYSLKMLQFTFKIKLLLLIPQYG